MGEGEETNMAVEAKHRNCTNTDQRNREDDREKRKVKKTVFHRTKSVVFFVFYHGTHALVGPRKAYNVGIWHGITRVISKGSCLSASACCKMRARGSLFCNKYER
jgi:hypothetical protein